MIQSLTVRLDPGEFRATKVARDMGRLLARLEQGAVDPRSGLRIRLTLASAAWADSEPMVRFRTSPGESATINWEFPVSDADAEVTENEIYRVLMSIIDFVAEQAIHESSRINVSCLRQAAGRVLESPGSKRVVSIMTIKALQVLWTVRQGGGAWDARQIDIHLGLNGGNVDGGVMPELRFLEDRQLVLRKHGQISDRWDLSPNGALVLGHRPDFPLSLG